MRTSIGLDKTTLEEMNEIKEKGLSNEGLIIKMMKIYKKYMNGELKEHC